MLLEATDSQFWTWLVDSESSESGIPDRHTNNIIVDRSGKYVRRRELKNPTKLEMDHRLSLCGQAI